MSNTLRKCSFCGVKKSLKHFYKQSDKSERYQSQCKKCMSRKYKRSKGAYAEGMFDVNWQRSLYPDMKITRNHHFSELETSDYIKVQHGRKL